MFLKSNCRKIFTLEDLAYFIPVTNANLTDVSISFPATSDKKVRKKLIAQF